MKTLNIILILGLLFCLYMISCESENDTNLNDTEFKVEFSDGTVVCEKDLIYYDSSTHLLFLKKDLEFKQPVSGFNVLVDNDTIYQGIIHPCVLSTPPPSPFFITDCYLYGNDIIEIGCYTESNDLRNDQCIIDALENSGLLHHGLSCNIDSIKVNSFDDYSEVICTITLHNNDNINYYILDPEKMGELDFNYYTGGLSFQNIDTKVSSFLRWSISNPNWDYLLHIFEYPTFQLLNISPPIPFPISHFQFSQLLNLKFINHEKNHLFIFSPIVNCWQ